MAAHAAFLRGMNLGRRRITNDELLAAFASIGFADARTFRASGNVAFESAGGPVEEIAGQIESGLARELGYAVPTFLRSAAEVRSIAALAPFPEHAMRTGEGKLQVLLLARKPAAAAARTVRELDDAEDRLALDGRELYWLPSGPMSGSALDLKALERLLGPTTIRTKGTIEQLAQRFFAP